MYRPLLAVAAILIAGCVTSPPASLPNVEDDAGVDLADATDPSDQGNPAMDATSGDGGRFDIGPDAALTDMSDASSPDAGPDMDRCSGADQIVRAGRCVQLVDPSYVVSVSPIEVTIADATIEATASTDAFTAANSVPFFTRRANNTVDVPANFQPDIWLSADGQVTTKRAGITGNVTIAGSVVEFDPARVKVQTGTFSTVGTTATVSIDPVDRNAAFLVFNYLSTGLSDLKRHSDVVGKFTDDQTIEFYRNSTNGGLEGHWYVVEALSGEFEVQHLPAATFDTAATSVVAPEEFAPEASFSIFSHASNIDTDDLALSHLSCTIATGTAIECARNGALYQIEELHAQVVTLNGIGQSVERGEFNIPANALEAVATLPTPAPGATVWGGYTGKPGACYTNTVSSIRTAGSFVSLSLTDDGSSVIARRGTPNDDLGLTFDTLPYVLVPRFQVIDW